MGELTTLAFVVFLFGGGVISNILKSQERRAELRVQQQQQTDQQVIQQIQALRAEVVGLRDTSTQFDVALEQSVQGLADRVGRIETRNSTLSYSEDKPVQQIGRG